MARLPAEPERQVFGWQSLRETLLFWPDGRYF